MKKTFLSLILIAIVAVSFAAETSNSASKSKTAETMAPNLPASVSISGKVIDLNSGEALAGVELTLEGLAVKVHSDLDGNFRIDNLRPGAYNVIASYISYNKSFIEKLEVGKSNQTLNIKLQAAN